MIKRDWKKNCITMERKNRSISGNDTIPGFVIVEWERQSAGRVGRPIPRHCAPQSIGIHCAWRQFDAHTPGTEQQCAVATSWRGRSLFRGERVAHTPWAQLFAKRVVKRRRNDESINKRSSSCKVFESLLKGNREFLLPVPFSLSLSFNFVNAYIPAMIKSIWLKK